MRTQLSFSISERMSSKMAGTEEIPAAKAVSMRFNLVGYPGLGRGFRLEAFVGNMHAKVSDRAELWLAGLI
jgi:hypothetical protein